MSNPPPFLFGVIDSTLEDKYILPPKFLIEFWIFSINSSEPPSKYPNVSFRNLLDLPNLFILLHIHAADIFQKLKIYSEKFGPKISYPRLPNHFFSHFLAVILSR